MGVFMINEVLHPSEHYLTQSNINQFEVSLDKEAISFLISEIARFKNEFNGINNLNFKITTKILKEFIDKNKNSSLSNACNKIIYNLCHISGLATLKNVPVDLSSEELEIMSFIISSYLGLPMYNNRDGVYIWPLIPKQIESSKDIEGNVRYGNTGNALNFHTDTTTFAGLLCVTPAESGGENEIVSTVLVHNELSRTHNNLLEVLYSNFFIDRRGEEMAGESPYATLPIFGLNKAKQLKTHWSKSYTLEAYKKHDVPPLSTAQTQALTLLEETILKFSREKQILVKAEKGDIIFMNNNLIFHNRLPFAGPRYLMRMWVYSEEYESFPHMFGYPYC